MSVSEMTVTPWYRQFWPWFLISLPVCAMVAGLSLLTIAYRGADSLVVDDYYREGRAINQTKQRDQRATALAVQADITMDGLDVALSLRGDLPVNPARLVLNVQHPLIAERDFTVSLARVDEALYQGSLPGDTAGRWYVTLTDEQRSWILRGEVVLEDGLNSLQLRPPS